MGQYFTNDNSIPSKLVKTRAVVLNNSFIFYTDNGVFSKDGLDFGSRLLLENIPLTELVKVYLMLDAVMVFLE